VRHYCPYSLKVPIPYLACALLLWIFAETESSAEGSPFTGASRTQHGIVLHGAATNIFDPFVTVSVPPIFSPGARSAASTMCPGFNILFPLPTRFSFFHIPSTPPWAIGATRSLSTLIHSLHMIQSCPTLNSSLSSMNLIKSILAAGIICFTTTSLPRA
jgi:hypothetical protein